MLCALSTIGAGASRGRLLALRCTLPTALLSLPRVPPRSWSSRAAASACTTELKSWSSRSRWRLPTSGASLLSTRTVQSSASNKSLRTTCWSTLALTALSVLSPPSQTAESAPSGTPPSVVKAISSLGDSVRLSRDAQEMGLADLSTKSCLSSAWSVTDDTAAERSGDRRARRLETLGALSLGRGAGFSASVSLSCSLCSS
mmetsp:Transcript_24422/g.49630  ORF Transcript_24422/g.49630 Transcript_24422/m.49630 type:complete len:201 (+) Transcript_24422:99-701(+)